MAASEVGGMNADEVGEVGQFLSTLLVLQGVTDIDAEDKAILVPKLRQWERAFLGRLAANTSNRCLALLTEEPHMRPMMQSVKTMLESCIQKCGVTSCPRVLQTSGIELLQCARCKAAVYCGKAHQKQAWPLHKATCFAPSF
ncbi:hypothetical protein BDZ94DRAFT_1265357 [Collybia nuda]|uniref:MYND-type domain-containing protein n=1 Tax=Collybia nuda TaxID=64659 RepID=A0A9P5Y1Q7_9AGAR|nr:hypothetical protein BDZ94DRAFT_1265357 [Collybia nuda]